MSRFFMRSGLLVPTLVASLCSALLETSSDGSLQLRNARGQYCTPSVIDEVAHILSSGHSKSGVGLCQVDRLADLLSTSHAEVQRAFKFLNLTTPQQGSGKEYPVTCAQLCERLEATFKAKLPGNRDTACNSGCEEDITCMDVSETRLAELFSYRHETRALHDNGVLQFLNRNQPDGPLTVKRPVRSISQTAQHRNGERQATPSATQQERHPLEPELLARLAAIFHMFVRVEPRQRNHGEGDSVALLEGLSSGDRCTSISGAASLAESLVTFATKQVSAGRAGTAAKDWFGRSASDEIFKKELLRIMKSVHTQIRRLQPVYPGPACEVVEAIAYVFADDKYVQLECNIEEAKETHCVQTLSGEPIIYLCDKFFKLDRGGQVETLLHEASHVADSYTQDVCMNEFGRETADIFLAVPAGTLGEEALGTFWAMEPPVDAPREHLMMNSDTDTEAIAEFWAREEGPDGSYELLVFYPFSGRPYGANSGCRVAYGREECQELAMLSPRKAIRNADNFALFVSALMQSWPTGRTEPLGCFLVGDWCVGDRVTLPGPTPRKGVVQYRTPTLNANFSVGQQVWVREYRDRTWEKGYINSTTPDLLVTVDRGTFMFGNIRQSLSEDLMVALRSDDGRSYIARSRDLICGDVEDAERACRGMLDFAFGHTDTKE